MNTIMLKRARALFCRDYIPAHIQRHNMRSWVRSLRTLGDNWLYAKYIVRTCTFEG